MRIQEFLRRNYCYCRIRVTPSCTQVCWAVLADVSVSHSQCHYSSMCKTQIWWHDPAVYRIKRKRSRFSIHDTKNLDQNRGPCRLCKNFTHTHMHSMHEHMCVWVAVFPFSTWTLLVGWQEGHLVCKNLGVGPLVVTIWLELCMSYNSSCHHHLHHT